MKDIITVFYSPLAQVYKAASIGDSLSDLQTFINDLIKTVEMVDEGEFSHVLHLRGQDPMHVLLAGQDNPNFIVQTFILGWLLFYGMRKHFYNYGRH